MDDHVADPNSSRGKGSTSVPRQFSLIASIDAVSRSKRVEHADPENVVPDRTLLIQIGNWSTLWISKV